MSQSNPNRDDFPLTAREREILALVAAGHSTEAVAGQLAIRPATVKSHLTNIYRKLRVKNRVQAVRYYLEHDGPPRPETGTRS